MDYKRVNEGSNIFSLALYGRTQMTTDEIINKCIETRSEYVENIKKALLGPGAEGGFPDEEHEVLSTSGKGRYFLGLLYPKRTDVEAEQKAQLKEEDIDFDDTDSNSIGSDFNDSFIQDVKEESDVNSDLDDSVNASAKHFPSSTGFTFFTEENISQLTVDVKFACYNRLEKYSECIARVEDSVTDNMLKDSPFELLQQNGNSFIKIAGKYDTCAIKSKDDVLNEINDFIQKLKEINNTSSPEEQIKKRVLYNAVNMIKTQAIYGEKRFPVSDSVTINFNSSTPKEFNSSFVNIPNTANLNFLKDKVKVSVLKRQINNLYSFTVMLSNEDEFSITGGKKNITLLQPEIKVTSSNFTFVSYSANQNFQNMDEEERNLELLYRNKKNYATGLGCAVDWEIDKNGKGFIKSDFFPTAEVPGMDFERDKNDFGFDSNENFFKMLYLSDFDSTDKIYKIESLRKFIENYKNWIDQKKEVAGTLDNNFKDTASKNLDLCEKSFKRMIKGIEKLENDDNAWEAFTLANSAMLMQRVQLKLHPKDDIYPGYNDKNLQDELLNVDYTKKDSHKWRPFQLAFLLMSVVSVTDDTDLERDIVDLIWFTTGGGKTEAYLGLTAMTIFYRRLAHPNESGGTTVIMRYTMRLLTTQQFLRAATLICACEKIRTARNDLGREKITIGLWIGGNHTPNRIADAATRIRTLSAARSNTVIESNSKFQVLKCPWCGTKLLPYWINKQKVGNLGYENIPGNIKLKCTQQSCYFKNELPIMVVDEQIYKNPPTLLFGTVDKFAMLPWKKEPGKFFGINTKNRSPELIIQDELHLISGALGTMVGIYEAAIDKLCQSKGAKPKIIASTATIRHAKEQCRALYNRDVMQFPSPGIDSDDSYFSKESKIDHANGKYGRLYVGMMSSKTKEQMEGRSIANLLQMSQVIQIKNLSQSDEDMIRDKFWTLTTYFNTTRELGNCRTLVYDNVERSINSLSYLYDGKKRSIGTIYELTGQTDSTELVHTLDKLEKTEYSQQNMQNKNYPVNILLATNMISVGIDISRLNVMLMVGQPKLTSEYIQASSRVGRNTPGVAFVTLDGNRNRDRSHFESFKSYHESFYKYVEPTSVTPFSKPSRDRALHAVVVTLLRNSVLGNANDAINLIDSNGNIGQNILDEIKNIKDFICKREESINSNLGMKSDKGNIQKEIDNVIEEWKALIIEYNNRFQQNNPTNQNAKPNFTYGDEYFFAPPGVGKGRLLKPYEQPSNDVAIETMTSLRHVSPMIHPEILQ